MPSREEIGKVMPNISYFSIDFLSDIYVQIKDIGSYIDIRFSAITKTILE